MCKLKNFEGSSKIKLRGPLKRRLCDLFQACTHAALPAMFLSKMATYSILTFEPSKKTKSVQVCWRIHGLC